MVNVDSYIKFITKHKLTQTQFLLLYLLYLKRLDLLKIYKEAYPTDDGSMLGTYFTNDLIKRGFLSLAVKGDKKNITLTDKFPNLFHDLATKADDVIRVYPGYVTTSTGAMLPLTVVDIVQFRKLYRDTVGDDPEEHEEIIKDIEYGRDNNLINFKIDSFISSKFYLKVREMRLAKKGSGVVGINLNDL
jgi:hypothetical protein